MMKVEIGRAFIADPYWAGKAESGPFGEMRECTLDRIMNTVAIINPATKDVIPAVAKRRAGIQEPDDRTGFPLPDRSPGQAPRE